MNKEIEKEFDEKISEYIKNISIGRYDDSGVNIGFIEAKDLIKQFISQAIAQTREETIKEERDRCAGEVMRVIVKNYEDASSRYTAVKGKKEPWAKSDAISENSKMVAYSRLEPEIMEAIYKITPKANT